jgi:hypothetical protein
LPWECQILIHRKCTDNADKNAKTVSRHSFNIVSIATDKNTDKTFGMAIQLRFRFVSADADKVLTKSN